MSRNVDCRGLSCPEPVILTRKALAANDLPVVVVVDAGASRDNVTRMAQKAGYRVAVRQNGPEFILTIDK